MCEKSSQNGPWRFECSNFTSKNVICVVHVLVKRSKAFTNPFSLFSSLYEFRLTLVGFGPRTSRSKFVDVNKTGYNDTCHTYGKFGNYTKTTFSPKLPKSEEILEIRKKLNFSFSKFRKNRSANFTKSM